MPGINRANQNKASSLLLFSLLLITANLPAYCDDLTGLPQNDPKDLMPAMSVPVRTTTSATSFVPMPVWARNIIMPPLPYQLKPMGKKPANPVASTAPSLTPPKDDNSATASTEPAVSTPKPAPAPETPAMVTVSPFLQWIKSNPNAAAQARQQANTYNASSTPPAPGAPGNAPTGPTGNGEDPYWLPPLIDSAGAVPVSGSAAIYSTPQR